MDKFLYFNELYCIYKGLLTEKESEIFSLYYEENNSMGEIAELKNISRSAVGSTIKIVENKLEKYEKILKNNELKKAFLEIFETCKDENTKKALERLIQEERE